MPKMNKIDPISIRDNHKKTQKVFNFSIFSSEIFRIGVELPQDLNNRPDY